LWKTINFLQSSININFFNELSNNVKSNKVVGDTATKSSSRHLWYLSVSLIGLAPFDNKVSSEMKVNMIKSLDSEKRYQLPFTGKNKK
jgi:hypothetical protein